MRFVRLVRLVRLARLAEVFSTPAAFFSGAASGGAFGEIRFSISLPPVSGPGILGGSSMTMPAWCHDGRGWGVPLVTEPSVSFVNPGV